MSPFRLVMLRHDRTKNCCCPALPQQAWPSPGACPALPPQALPGPAHGSPASALSVLCCAQPSPALPVTAGTATSPVCPVLSYLCSADRSGDSVLVCSALPQCTVLSALVQSAAPVLAPTMARPASRYSTAAASAPAPSSLADVLGSKKKKKGSHTSRISLQ